MTTTQVRTANGATLHTVPAGVAGVAIAYALVAGLWIVVSDAVRLEAEAREQAARARGLLRRLRS